MVSVASQSSGRGRLFLIWLVGNLVLLVVAAAIWAWGDYQYVKYYGPPEKMRALSQGIIYALPVTVLLLNLFLLRRLCLWRHLVYALVTTLLVSGAWWWLFNTVGTQWHISLGGTLH